MTYKFLKAIDIIFGNEGGYSNHRNDKGGATNFGITQATLREACNKKLTTIRNVKNLTTDVCKNIYYEMYWKPSKAEDLLSPIDLIHFDMAVNSGVKAAHKLFQRVINVLSTNENKIVVDAIIGKKTLTAYNNLVQGDINKALEFSYKYLELRSAFYEAIIRNNPSQKVFRNGWMNRLNHLKSIIQKGY